MSVANAVPPALRPFQTLGLDLDFVEGKEELLTTCPLCGEEGKFSLNVTKGAARCFACQAGGKKEGGGLNLGTFLGLWWEKCIEETGEDEYRVLAADRRLLSWRTLRQWGICKNLLTDEWMIPTWKAEGKVGNLYRYTFLDGKMAVLGLPDTAYTKPGMFGLFTPGVYDGARTATFQCEGVWDAMALWEVLRQTRIDDDGSIVQGVADTLASTCNVLAVPGCGVWEKVWSKVFKGHTFTICYDSDHPKVNPKTEQLNEPVGYASARRVGGLLRGVGKDGPALIRYVSWGEEGYDPELPSGFDVRDLLTLIDPPTLPNRVAALGELLGKVVDAPEDWKALKHGEESLRPRSCSSWKVLQTAFQKSMNWSDSLDTGLAVVLASAMSPAMTDDLLWIKFIAPPSCLDADTPIFDPVTDTGETIENRWLKGCPFNVYTLEDGRVTVSEAAPPIKFPKTGMYEVSFRSGNTMRVTMGHRFWNGFDFVSLHVVAQRIHESGSYPLPTISDTALSTLMPGVRRLRKTVLDYQERCCACPCPCDELPRTVGDTYQGASPSQGDVRERTRSLFGKGVLGNIGKCSRQPRDHHSSCRAPFRDGQQDGCLHPVNGGTFGHTPDYCPSFEQQQQRLSLGRTGQQPCLSSSLSRWRIEPRHQTLARLERLLQMRRVTHGRLSLLNLQIGKRQRFVASSPVSAVSSSLAEGLPQLREGTSERFGFQSYQGLGNTQEASCRTDKVQPACGDDRKTTEQPSCDLCCCAGMHTLSEVDAIVKVTYLGERHYYDFHVPGTENYWACGYFHHNTGKSTIAEAVSVSEGGVVAVSTLNGLYSGYREKDSDEDHSLMGQLKGKCLVVKDADPLLREPNKDQILSQLRDAYDKVARSNFKIKSISRKYTDHPFSCVLFGTSALRELDTESDLGLRYLDYVMMEEIDDEVEKTTVEMVTSRAISNWGVATDSNGRQSTEEDKLEAMRLTGGYLDYLRENYQTLLQGITITREAKERCELLAVFTSHMRARPSDSKEATAQREYAPRLALQLLKLAACVTVVTGREKTDVKVLKVVAKVARDTARGRTMEIARHLFRCGKGGSDVKALMTWTGHKLKDEQDLLQFLLDIGAVERFLSPAGKVRWRLSEKMARLYREAMK